MLEKIRKPGRAKNVFATLIFGAIVLVFVFFGMGPGELGGLVGGGSAAVVNDEMIPIRAFENMVQRMEQTYGASLDQLPAAQRKQMTQTLRQQALTQLINQEVAAQAGRSVGIIPSDEEVMKSIVNIPIFQEDGVFRRRRYDIFLENARTNSADFEKEVRKDIIRRQVHDFLAIALEPSPLEAEKIKKAQETKLNIAFVSFTRERLKSAYSPDAQTLKKYLAENEEQVQQYYESNKQEFSEPEQVRASHILISTNNKSPEEALKEAKELKAKLNAKNFGEMAAQHSDDTGSKPNKGDLGFFTREQMVPEFSEAAFTMEVGQVSDPVKTNFGYHLIKVDAKKPAKTDPFEAVKTRIASQLIAEGQLDQVLADLREALTGGQRDKVESWIKKYNLNWQETGLFEVGAKFAPKLGGNEQLIAAAVKHQPGQIAPELVESQGSYHVLRLKEVQEGQPVEEPMPLQARSSERALDVYGRWAQTIKSNSKIVSNRQLIAN